MATDNVERAKGKRVVKPIVYGNTAQQFVHKKEYEHQHTHSWTVFLKMYHDEDPSRFIRKVQFKLHDSYANPIRVVEAPPFEVTETGWGEFEVQIRIYFIDVNEKPVTAFHYLRLFQPVVTQPNGRQMTVAECYDEIVFQEPTMVMYKALTGGEVKKCDPKKFSTDFVATRKECLDAVNAARAEATQEIDDLKASLRDAYALIRQYREENVDDDPATPS